MFSEEGSAFFVLSVLTVSRMRTITSSVVRSLRPVPVDPSYVFAFIETFISTLEDYLVEVSSSSIRDHFDVVYQVGISCSFTAIDELIRIVASRRNAG